MIEISLLGSALRGTEIILFSIMSTYLFRKYQQTKLRISLYWAIGSIMFLLVAGIQLVLYMVTLSFETASLYSMPFMPVGMGLLAIALANSGILTNKAQVGEGIVGTLMVLGALTRLYTPFFTVSMITLGVLSILVVGGYTFAAIKDRNKRLGLIAIGLLIFACAGIVLAANILTDEMAAMVRIGAVSLLAGGLLLRKAKPKRPSLEEITVKPVPIQNASVDNSMNQLSKAFKSYLN